MRHFLIIGAASGIGEALLDRLKDDAKITATYHRTNPKINHPNVNYIEYDVCDEDMNLQIEDPIDGFVYCPGTINLKPFHRMKTNDFDSDLDVNLKGLVRTLQPLIGQFNKDAISSVVFFSTVAVQTGFKFHASIAMAKGAIEGLTRSLAAEYAPNIRFNCIAPSLTDTPLAEKLLSTDDKRANNAERHPMKSVGKPEDIAELALYLLHEKSNWMTGQILHMDGGISTLKA
jgi:NAD(P)-dependent dehydrogenase (short-subunit alcohol dehydrogenase family)